MAQVEVEPLSPEENLDSAVCTLYDCIDVMCQSHQLDETQFWYCTQCKEHRAAYQQQQLWKLPSILIIQLQRFSYTSDTSSASAASGLRDIDASRVEFPIEGLDLSRYVGVEQTLPPIYDLYAVSVRSVVFSFNYRQVPKFWIH